MIEYACVHCKKKFGTSVPRPIPVCNQECWDKWDHIIEFEGMNLKVSSDRIKPGDTYLAKRNTGWKLLTCKLKENGYIRSVEFAYPYDEWECFKVVEML